MPLDSDDIARLAHLARLDFDAGARARLLEQLNGFFATVEAMSAIDTEGVEPLAHPLAAVQQVALRLRPDVASEPDAHGAIQQNAPAVEDGLFLVPRVIE